MTHPAKPETPPLRCIQCGARGPSVTWQPQITPCAFFMDDEVLFSVCTDCELTPPPSPSPTPD